MNIQVFQRSSLWGSFTSISSQSNEDGLGEVKSHMLPNKGGHLWIWCISFVGQSFSKPFQELQSDLLLSPFHRLCWTLLGWMIPSHYSHYPCIIFPLLQVSMMYIHLFDWHFGVSGGLSMEYSDFCENFVKGGPEISKAYIQSGIGWGIGTWG